jgi:hypothetical protein
MNSATVKITIRGVKTDCSGDIAYDAGDYTEDIRGGGVVMQGGIKMEGGVKINPPNQVTGEYLVVLRRTSGKWRIVQHASVQRHIEQN